ncbi:right-handed parallel beta-helix repeat-containing protein [Desulfococcaceae bacterium HSG7]|nr:right-handed parallel beta-helix repeat-containing protein [Desulfococcaceae bacterium HSG7]
MKQNKSAFFVNQIVNVILINLILLACYGPVAALAAVSCPSLAVPTGSTVSVNTEAELRLQASSAAPDTVIMIEAGTYLMQDVIHVVNNGIVLRGGTGNRDDVILDFGGMDGEGHFGILVDGDDVTIADLTIRNANDHGVSIQGRDRPKLYNLHILDIGDQLVKVNPPTDGSNGSEDGLLACSLLEYTTNAPDNYTNGISAHQALRWTVRDNEFRRIRGPSGDAGPAVLFWSESLDTIVERNLLADCYRGISFGDASHTGIDHSGGIVRNNFIYGSLFHDTAIEMVHAQNWIVAHNSVILLNPVSGLTWGIEARYAESNGTFAYNLTNMDIVPDRDSAVASLNGNITDAETNWFVDNAVGGNLHLQPTATAAIDQASALPSVTDDFEGESRSVTPDIGADETEPLPTVASTVPVYRFYSELLKKHFFTKDSDEKDFIIANNPTDVWRYEGIAWYVYPDAEDGLSPVYRFYSELLQSHFYTTDANEKDYIIATFSVGVWRYEGIAWYVYTDYQAGTLSVYRFYSELLRVHFYTMDENEKNVIIATSPEDIWRYEGITYYAYP